MDSLMNRKKQKLNSVYIVKDLSQDVQGHVQTRSRSKTKEAIQG